MKENWVILCLFGTCFGMTIRRLKYYLISRADGNRLMDFSHRIRHLFNFTACIHHNHLHSWLLTKWVIGLDIRTSANNYIFANQTLLARRRNSLTIIIVKILLFHPFFGRKIQNIARKSQNMLSVVIWRGEFEFANVFLLRTPPECASLARNWTLETLDNEHFTGQFIVVFFTKIIARARVNKIAYVYLKLSEWMFFGTSNLFEHPSGYKTHARWRSSNDCC